ncbi:DUF3551 domain-containing protein [Bradyrhizobium sp. WD16]|uniref:DUF3551 domain-containing protein n=1 Tax=Bradyrhizobium sp. WD16 TaxID=1521768 RepID=UPI0020A56A7C|nr:DUF3551 domain-containing protein [Bradyrhizobium sp. WD16]UTD28944.1 hypothetical protein DB459_20645 [Bradyrhizobium sp. WD16]
MRRMLLAAVAATGFGWALASPAPAAAETIFPICLHWKGDLTDCRYTSMAQCNASASGLGADCLYNPAYAAVVRETYDEAAPPPRRKRIRRHAE